VRIHAHCSVLPPRASGSAFVQGQGAREVNGKAILAARKDELAQNLTRKLLAYALCRQLEGYDEIVVDELMETIAKDGYRMQTLISEIVTSYPFVNRRILELKASSNDP
jgi:hypothetical protein